MSAPFDFLMESNDVLEKELKEFAEVVLYMNDIPQGFASHTVYGRLVGQNDNGVVIIIPWGGTSYRYVQFNHHAIIGMEMDMKSALDGLGIDYE